MIDGLVGHCGEHLTNLWKRDEGGTGQYPPPTLHVSSDLDIIFQLNLFSFSFCKSVFQPLVLQALLDIYLMDNIDEAAKHAIVSLSGVKFIGPSPPQNASILLIKNHCLVIEFYFLFEP